MKQFIIILIFSSFLLSQEFQIARVQYGGGGDWYSDPSSLPNLLKYLRTNTPMVNASEEVRIKLTDSNAKQYPYLYLTGHGNVKFSENEIIELRSILSNGGFLHADDNYGMDKSFRREIKKVFPNKEFIELPHTHPVFFSFYEFENGLPKIHEHDNKPPQALAIFLTLPPVEYISLGIAEPPMAFLAFFLPPGVTLPEQTAEAYILAYALGYTLNFLFAAAFPFGQSLAIMISPFVLLF